MVGQFSRTLNQARSDNVQVSTQHTYDVGVRHWFDFCLQFGIPVDIFTRSAEDIAYAFTFFAAYLRDTIPGRTKDQEGKLLPLTATTITSQISAVISFVGRHDAAAAATIRSPDLTRIIKGMGKRDAIARGPRNSWCNITMGAEAAHKVIEYFVEIV